MKTEFETQWEREFDRAFEAPRPNPASCLGGCVLSLAFVALIMFFTFWLLLELAERI